MTDLEERMAALVERIRVQLAELDQVTGEALPNALGPPAAPAQVADLERQRRVRLPADYRAFLSLHDGWAGFSGENALLSTQEMLRGPVFDGIAELQAELRRTKQTGPGTGLVLEGGYGTRMSYFDLERATTGKDPEVALWDRGEVARYPSFTAFLEAYADSLDELIAAERANLR